MEQFHEPPQTHSRKNIAVLFQNITENAAAKPNNDHFVPFAQERDKLGRLISREAKLRDNKNHQSLPSDIAVKPTKNLERIQPDKPKLSSAALQRMFKLNEVKQFKSSKHLDKIRILSTSSRQKILAPLVGHYDIAAIADKIKFKKPTLIALKSSKQSPKPPNRQSQSQGQMKAVRKAGGRKEERAVAAKPEGLRVQVNYDLPELEKYHQMKKLKMKHYDNFEQNHLKFKELARFSLVLASQIKKGLELD